MKLVCHHHCSHKLVKWNESASVVIDLPAYRENSENESEQKEMLVVQQERKPANRSSQRKINQARHQPQLQLPMLLALLALFLLPLLNFKEKAVATGNLETIWPTKLLLATPSNTSAHLKINLLLHLLRTNVVEHRANSIPTQREASTMAWTLTQMKHHIELNSNNLWRIKAWALIV